MGERQWQPGDVGVTEDGTVGIVVAIETARGCPEAAEHPREPHWHFVPGTYSSLSWEGVRPLVVIDPEDAEQVERLASLLHRQIVQRSGSAHSISDLAAALREFANPTQPKPDEPQGLGAVVRDAEGKTWVKVGKRSDWYQAHGKWAQYHSIDAIEVLSEGVTP